MPRAGNSNSDDILVQGNQSPPSQTNAILLKSWVTGNTSQFLRPCKIQDCLWKSITLQPNL